MEDAVNELLIAAEMMSPDQEAQTGFRMMVSEMRTSGQHHVIIMKRLINAMSAGLEYGDWPEVKR